ncbi:hypothetical protein HYW59_02160 [Candidatus Kaiserbacteria bacterium]|nr:hypothetical protein [Candidatus Kaiserbacteria bacterium]
MTEVVGTEPKIGSRVHADGPQTTSLLEEIEEALTNGVIDSTQFVGRRVRVNGYNYVLETTISGMQIAIVLHSKFAERPDLKNVRFTLKDSVVSIDKKRYRMTRTIDHLSYAYGWTTKSMKVDSGDMKVVFKDDGLETIKAASMDLLD